MTIFWKRPLTAVALGALFVGAISCGGKDGKDGQTNAAGGGVAGCTVTGPVESLVLNCPGSSPVALSGKYQQICFKQNVYSPNLSSGAGLFTVSTAPMIPNSATNGILVVNTDGTTGSVGGTAVVNPVGLASGGYCYNFALPKAGTVLYQVTSGNNNSNTNNNNSGSSTHLVPVSAGIFPRAAHIATTPAGASSAQTVYMQDSDTILSTYIVNLLSNANQGGYRSAGSFTDKDWSSLHGASVPVATAALATGPTIAGVYYNWAAYSASSATLWAQASTPANAVNINYLAQYLTTYAPGQLAFLAAPPICKFAGVYPTTQSSAGLYPASGTATGAGAGPGTFSPNSTTPVSNYIGDYTVDTANQFTVNNGLTGAGNCVLTKFAGLAVGTGAVANLTYTLNGNAHSTTSTPGVTTCQGYTASKNGTVAVPATGAAFGNGAASGGIVASIVNPTGTPSYATTAVATPGYSVGYYFVRHMDLTLGNDLPAGIFGIYYQTNPALHATANAATTVALNAQVGDGIAFQLTGITPTVVASDYALPVAAGAQTLQTLASSSSVVGSKWVVVRDTTTANVGIAYGFSTCTASPSVGLTVVGGQVTFALNAVGNVSTGGLGTGPLIAPVGSTLPVRVHFQMAAVKADYAGDLTAYTNLQNFIHNQMAMNGQILDVVFDTLAPSSTTAGKNTHLAAMAVKSGVLCGNSDTKFTMFSSGGNPSAALTVAGSSTSTSAVTAPLNVAVTDVVFGHSNSYLPNVAGCFGDPHALVAATVVDTGIAYSAYADERGCVVLPDVANGNADGAFVTTFTSSAVKAGSCTPNGTLVPNNH